MTDRIQSYLNGAVERGRLTPDERAEADTIEPIIEATRALVAARPAPDLVAGVMRQIEESGLRPAASRRTPAIRRLAEHLWTPRRVSFQFRPVYGMVAAAVVVALIVFSPYSRRAPAAAPTSAAGIAQPQAFVQFWLEAAPASNVRLAGSFTNWQPQYELHEAAPGVWTVTLPLPLGVHDYAFVVDGQRWVADPYAPHVDDGFGGTNSRIALLPPDAPRSRS